MVMELPFFKQQMTTMAHEHTMKTEDVDDRDEKDEKEKERKPEVRLTLKESSQIRLTEHKAPVCPLSLCFICVCAAKRENR